MVMARNQGSVIAAVPIRPHFQWSRFKARNAGQPQSQARAQVTAINAGPIGPLVRTDRLREIQNNAASRRDGFWARLQRQDKQLTIQKASVASVVASFDSTTMI